MNEIEGRGHEVIAQAVRRLAGDPVVVIEMHRQLGDVLHSTLVVRHIRASHPTAKIVWAISESYGQTFEAFTPEHLGPHAVALLPVLPAFPDDGAYRIRWVEQAKLLPGVIRAFGCGVHPWGWKRGSIVDGILNNAGICVPTSTIPTNSRHPRARVSSVSSRSARSSRCVTIRIAPSKASKSIPPTGPGCRPPSKASNTNTSSTSSAFLTLAVARQPWLPITAEDHEFADQFIARHGLRRFVTMEYSSYSLPVASSSWYIDFVKHVGIPVIALAGPEFETVPGSIDGRATTFRQAKALIARSNCFLGGCSGLSVIAASNGCDQPVVEIGPAELSMVGIGYRNRGDRHQVCQGKTPLETATEVRRIARR